MSVKIRKGDLVQVITGSKTGGKKGKQGRVLAVSGDRVWVEGVNLTTRHRKRVTNDKGTSSGGLEKRESPMHISNVALVDPETGAPTKVGFLVKTSGDKTVRVRFAKKSGKELT